MANEQLRAALVRAGLDPEDLADQLQVDVKTVQRWFTGRLPHARHRARIANLLGRPERDLWPEIADTTGPADDRRDLAGIYTRANDVRAPDWRTLLHDAHQQIDLLDYTLADILTAPATTSLLADKATAGCRIRVLVAHPKSIWVTSLAQQLGQQETDPDGNTLLDREIDQALQHLQPLTGRAGMELRTFWAERTLTILRFDDQMLVTQHLYATPATHAPLLYLRRHADDGLFESFADHFQRVLDHASDPLPTDLIHAG